MKVGDQRSLAALRETLLKAALDTSLWHGALETMAAATGSLRAQLLGVDARGEIAFNFMTGADETYASDFLAIAGHHDTLVNYRIAASAGVAPGTVLWEKHYDAVKSQLRDNAYVEASEKHHQPFGCQTALAVEDGAMVGLAVMHSRSDGRTTPAQRAYFASAASAAQSALRLQRSIEDRGTAIAQGALDLIEAPVLLMDGFGKVAGMTGAAEKFVVMHSAVQIRGRMLVAARMADTWTLHRKLRSVLDRQQLDTSMLLHSPNALPLLIKIQALPDTEMGFGFQPRALIALGAESSRTRKSGDFLREQYGLTTAESEVVALLAQGMRRADIAQRRSTSLGTVQQQIKTAFAKTGVSREAELLALIGALNN